jgi:hypothetical protein
MAPFFLDRVVPGAFMKQAIYDPVLARIIGNPSPDGDGLDIRQALKPAKIAFSLSRRRYGSP